MTHAPPFSCVPVRQPLTQASCLFTAETNQVVWGCSYIHCLRGEGANQDSCDCSRSCSEVVPLLPDVAGNGCQHGGSGAGRRRWPPTGGRLRGCGSACRGRGGEGSRSDGQVVPSFAAAALMLPACSASARRGRPGPGRQGTGWAASPEGWRSCPRPYSSALSYERVLSEADVEQYAAIARMRLRLAA
jgi:hypothetical protein